MGEIFPSINKLNKTDLMAVSQQNLGHKWIQLYSMRVVKICMSFVPIMAKLLIADLIKNGWDMVQCFKQRLSSLMKLLFKS